MSKRTIGIFFIISILMDLIGAGLIIGGLVGSTAVTTENGYSTNTQLTSIGHPGLFAIGVILASLSVIPFLVAWIGALVNLARLQQWVWLILMIIFSWITLIVYLIAGPTTRPGFAQAPQYAPQNYPQQPYYNPQQQQNYPQQPYYNPQQQQNYPQQQQYNPEAQQNFVQPPQYNPGAPQNNPQPPQEYPRS